MIDKVISVVAEQPIYLSEFEDQMSQYKAQGSEITDELKAYVFEDMMNQKLYLYKAQIDSIIVDDAEVNGQIERRISYFEQQLGGKEALEKVQQSLPFPEKSYVLTMDMEAPDTFTAKVNEVIHKFGKVDLLFLNAGISQRSYAAKTDISVDRRLMEVNYFGPVALTKILLPFLQKQSESYIAVNSSLAGKFGFFERSAYSASKFALHGFFESLRLEEAEHNVNVNILCAIGIKTEISQNALDGNGKPFDKTSALQEEGIAVDDCVSQMVLAIETNKKEVIIGKGMQRHSTKIKELLPELFFKMLAKRKP